MVEFSPVELAWLEILVGFYPVDGLAQFVEITNGVAVAIGIKKSLHRLSHNSEFFDRQLILVAVPTSPMIPRFNSGFPPGRPAFPPIPMQRPRMDPMDKPSAIAIPTTNR